MHSRYALVGILVGIAAWDAGCAVKNEPSVGASGSAVTGNDLVSLALANVADGSGLGKACGQNSLGGQGYESSCYGDDDGPEYWCADFVQWVWANSGVDTTGLSAAAGSFYVYGQNNNTLNLGATTPKVGDAVVFDYGIDGNGPGAADHVAIVSQVNVADHTIVTVSGDWGGTSDDENTFGSQSSVQVNPAYDWTVGRKPSVMNMTISGFITAVGLSAPVPPNLTEGSQTFVPPMQQHYSFLETGGTLQNIWWDGNLQAFYRNPWGTGIAGEPVTFFDSTDSTQHVFARTDSGTIAHYDYNVPANSMQQESFGSNVQYDPTAIQVGDFYDVWAVDNTNTLQQWYEGYKGGSWQQATWGAGVAVAGRPSVFVINGQQHVFARGTSGTLEHWWWDPTSNATSHDQWNLSGSGIVLAGDPAALPVGSVDQDVWAIDTNGNLQQWFWAPGGTVQNVTWGSGVVGRPSAFVVNGQQHVFARGTAGTLEHFYWDPTTNVTTHDTWNSASSGIILTGDPTAIQINSAQQHVWAQDSNGNAQHWFFDPTTGQITNQNWGQ